MGVSHGILNLIGLDFMDNEEHSDPSQEMIMENAVLSLLWTHYLVSKTFQSNQQNVIALLVF